MCKYYISKKKHCKEKIHTLTLHFSNGDDLCITKGEIADLQLQLYDRLVCYGKQTSAVVASGFIKLKIQQNKKRMIKANVFDSYAYRKDRKQYIEGRLMREPCTAVSLFDELNWSDTVLGDAMCEMEDEYLVIRYRHNPKYGACESDRHVICLADVALQRVHKIFLDFENCEGFAVFQSEILDMHLCFHDELEWNSSGYARHVKSGFLRLKLDPSIHRERHLFSEHSGQAKQDVRSLYKRLCIGKGETEIDICHLYVITDRGYGVTSEESIGVDSLYQPEMDSEECDFDAYDEEDLEDTFDPYISGYATRQRDGSVLIRLGASKEL